MAAEYLNQRIRKDVVEKLRKFERRLKLQPSITKTIEKLLETADLVYKKLK